MNTYLKVLVPVLILVPASVAGFMYFNSGSIAISDLSENPDKFEGNEVTVKGSLRYNEGSSALTIPSGDPETYKLASNGASIKSKGCQDLEAYALGVGTYREMKMKVKVNGQWKQEGNGYYLECSSYKITSKKVPDELKQGSKKLLTRLMEQR